MGICKLIIHNWTPAGDDIRIEQIAQALRDFGEERVKEALDRDDRSVFEGGKSEGRAESLEEAANIVETSNAPWEEYLERNAGLRSLKAFEVFVAERIRAIQSKNPAGSE